MFSRKIPKIRRTLALRLTFWYAGIFALCASVAFLIFYLLVSAVIRQQTDEELLEQASRFSNLLAISGEEAAKRVAVLEAQAAGEKQVFFRFLSPSGDVFSSSNVDYWKTIPINSGAIEALLQGRAHVYETVPVTPLGRPVRILYAFVGPGTILQTGQSMEAAADFVRAFRRMFIGFMTLLILPAAAVGWFMARRALAGVTAVTRTAKTIADGNLDQRVPIEARGDEIDELALTFNRMVDRIQELITEIREMSDNIAHDLKSPITRIRGLAEVTLTTAEKPEGFRTMASSAIEECDRLLDMINTMLFISRTESGVHKPERIEMDLSGMLQAASELLRPVAEDSQVYIHCNTSGPMVFRGDKRMIQRLIANLIDNAVKYTPPGGRVTAALHRSADRQFVISISDTGTGISAADLPHIFDRFYRGDQSRSQPGTGMGLSLARTVARAHGGEISVESRPGEGSTFRVHLPDAPKT
jgi:heavy metal sensor kinase